MALPQFKLGLISARLRQPHALYHFERAVELDPTSSHYLERLATQYERLKRWDDALRRYREAAELEPENKETQAAIARLMKLISRQGAEQAAA